VRPRLLMLSVILVVLAGLQTPALAALVGPDGPNTVAAASESAPPRARIPPVSFRRRLSLRFTNRTRTAVVVGRVTWVDFYYSRCIVHVPVRLMSGQVVLKTTHTNELGRFSMTCSCSPPLQAEATTVRLGPGAVCLKAVGHV
jgi:hypothetical protein